MMIAPMIRARSTATTGVRIIKRLSLRSSGLRAFFATLTPSYFPAMASEIS